MNNMKPREKVLLVATIVAVIIFAAWQFGLEGVISNVAAGDTDLERLEEEFEDNIERLEDIYLIERDFRRIGEFPVDEEGDIRPDVAFTLYVAEICRENGFDFPPLKPEREDIEGVENYELINVAVRIEGTYDDTVRLLKTFEENSLIFREVAMTYTRDSPRVITRVTVSRIAPVQQRASRLDRLSR